MTVDTSNEAVERRASYLAAQGFTDTAATLRALAGERDALRQSNDRTHEAMAQQRRVMTADRDRLAAEVERLRGALDKLRAIIVRTDGGGSIVGNRGILDACDILDAALGATL